MSKSTPINQLPMTNNAEPSNNSNESELVQEILREIQDTQNVELNNPIVENTEPSANLNMSIDTPPQNPVDNQMQMPMPQPQQGGIAQLAGGMRPKDYFEGQVYDDRGDGMSDDISFKVDGDPVIKGAKLSADEYVMPADLVAMLGNGSSDAGAKKLDAFTKEMRMKAFGTTEQQKPINATKELKDMV